MAADTSHALLLADLERRVARLEARVFAEADATPQGALGTAPSAAPAVGVERPGLVGGTTTPPRQDIGLTEPPVGARSMPELLRGLRGERGPSAFDIERLIGGKTFAALGALAVVIAAGLFLKLAYDQGWLGRIPDLWKCVSAAAFGVALLGAGEVALRRWGRLASAGLTSAGLGVIYAAAFAAHAMYALVGAPGAFAMLGATTLLGVLLAGRSRLAFVASLSLAGGYLAPVLLRESDASPYFLPSYLVALLVTGLMLSARLGASFTAPRIVATLGTTLLGTAWVFDGGDARPWLVVAFAGASWAALHLDAALRSVRADRRGPGDAERDRAEPHDHPDTTRVTLMLGGSFTLTAWAIWLAMWAGSRAEWVDWAPPFVGFVVTTLAALPLGGREAIRRTPVTLATRLGGALLCQSGALLLLTLAIALSGAALTFAGLALACASLVAARALDSRGLLWYGVVTLALATGRLVFFEFASVLEVDMIFAAEPWGEVALGGVTLTRWTVMAALGALSWILAAWVGRAGRVVRLPDGVRLWFVGIAFSLLLLSVVSEDSTARGLSVAWLAMSAATAPLAGALTRLPAHSFALVGLTLSIAAWALGWPPQEWGASARVALVHPALLVAYGILAAHGLSVWISRRRDAGDLRALTAWWSGIVALLLAFVASSAEVARLASALVEDRTAQLASLTVWWSVFACAMIVGGFRLRAAPVRHAGLGLLAIAAGKAVVVDLSAVEPAWRVVSFLGVGLLMLGVAAGYARVSRAMARAQHGEKDEPPA